MMMILMMMKVTRKRIPLTRKLVLFLQVFIHDATMISPYPLLFFGGEISVLVEEGHEIIAVDEFIRFRSPRKIANIVKVSQ